MGRSWYRLVGLDRVGPRFSARQTLTSAAVPRARPRPSRGWQHYRAGRTALRPRRARACRDHQAIDRVAGIATNPGGQTPSARSRSAARSPCAGGRIGRQLATGVAASTASPMAPLNASGRIGGPTGRRWSARTPSTSSHPAAGQPSSAASPIEGWSMTSSSNPAPERRSRSRRILQRTLPRRSRPPAELLEALRSRDLRRRPRDGSASRH